MPIPNDSADRFWRSVQAVSGLAFAVFLLAHLANTLFAFGAAPAYDAVQSVVRAVYQVPVVEILLLAVVLPAHITAGIARARLRRRAGMQPAGTVLRLHRLAGWLLVAVVYWHAAAVRLPALLFAAPPRFAGVSFALHWLPAWFYPYYFVLALAGFCHLLVGLAFALPRCGIPLGRLRPRTFAIATTCAAVTCAGVLLAFGGVLFDVGDPFAGDYARITRDFFARGVLP